MAKLKLSASVVRRLGPGAYWDTTDVGFGLIVRDSGRSTWTVQRALAGRTVRVKLGEYPSMTADQARDRAREVLVDMARGINPNREKKAARSRGMTLQDAMDNHIAAMRARDCSERSIEGVRWVVEKHLADFLARPLASIAKSDAVARHQRIGKKSGIYVANGCMRALRAIYSTAARQSDDLPPNPVRAVTFFKERRRREPVADLAAWAAKVAAIQNPVRRALQRFLMLTGLRSRDAATVKWSEIDFKAETLHRPRPKGGVDRAYTVPIAKVVVDLLKECQQHNAMLFPGGDGGWVFPTTDKDGEVTHVQVVREKGLPSPHRLRDSFCTAALEAGCDPFALKLMVNHALPGGDVTMGYQRPSNDWLRAQVEKVAAHLAARMLPVAAAAS